MIEERLPFHLDSIIALGLFGYAVVVAVTINHSHAKARVFGIALGAAGCLSVAGGIVFLDLIGEFAELRPHRYSIDPFKPVIMRVLAAVFLLAGLCLALVAWRQKRRQDALVLPVRNEEARFGLLSRYFHWTIAILCILLVPMGVFATMLTYDVEYRLAYYVVHKSIGLTVVLLAIARIVWLMFSPAPALSPGLSRWERLAARVAHFSLYFFLFAFPISGFVLGTSLGKLSHFYFWDLPLLWGPDEESLALARLWHKLVLPFAFFLVLAGHILGALKHRFIDKDADSFRRMAT